MTNEEKQLLLIDLCARLPHGVVCEMSNDVATITEKIGFPGIEQFADGNIVVKPYLRPMSSMTEEELSEYRDTCRYWNIRGTVIYENTADSFDWLNAHHFDYRGLIPMGLALEAPNDMYKTE